MTVEWTENALDDLAAIRAYIARNSKRYAQRMIERIFDRTTILSDHPRLGAEVPELGTNRFANFSKIPSASFIEFCQIGFTSYP